jgi:hypothetical protein
MQPMESPRSFTFQVQSPAPCEAPTVRGSANLASNLFVMVANLDTPSAPSLLEMSLNLLSADPGTGAHCATFSSTRREANALGNAWSAMLQGKAIRFDGEAGLVEPLACSEYGTRHSVPHRRSGRLRDDSVLSLHAKITIPEAQRSCTDLNVWKSSTLSQAVPYCQALFGGAAL